MGKLYLSGIVEQVKQPHNFKIPLEPNTWEEIEEASRLGVAENYWPIGDTKKITINGPVGFSTTKQFNNVVVDTFIIGFNHNSAVEGNNRIHFLIGKINGKFIGLCDDHYDEHDSSRTGFFVTNGSSHNMGGWGSSGMRLNILGPKGSYNSNNGYTLYNALPSDLRAVMKETTKYTDNTGSRSDSTINKASNVTATQDQLFLLSEFEVFGARTHANNAEQNYQAQYDYYKAGNSKKAYKHEATTTSCVWWLRSPRASSTDVNSRYETVAVNTSGNVTTRNSGTSGAVVPAFSV